MLLGNRRQAGRVTEGSISVSADSEMSSCLLLLPVEAKVCRISFRIVVPIPFVICQAS